MSSGNVVIAQLQEQAGGRELIARAGSGDEVALVGGAVRDLLLGRKPRELDVVVASGAAEFAQEMARALAQQAQGGVEVTVHERFGTASVAWQHGLIDIATRRAESYATPGALPEVRPGSVEEDLARRDFTVNALAVPLAGPRSGELMASEHALEDLGTSRLRVLHERSFIDDPTRLLRLARYRARLGFETESRTARLAAEALAAGALATVSGTRVGAELRLALREPDAVEALASFDDVGVIAALAPGLAFDRALADAALALLPPEGDAQELLLASLLLGPAGRGRERSERALKDLLDELEFAADARDRVARSAARAPQLAQRLGLALRPSQLHELLAAQPLEGVALAGALGARAGSERAGAQAQLWLGQLRHVRLVITGDDLLAAGLAPGPQIGRRLELALASKLDGELPAEDRSAELLAALEASV